MTRVLVIEDEADLLQNIRDTLTFEGFEVDIATDGLQGLQLAFEFLPDVIVCDINMPEMNGYEVLDELRRASETATLPFIFMTARSDRDDIRTGMNLGADDYITKPFQLHELVTAIRARLARRDTVELGRMRAFSHRLVSLQENERRNLAQRLQEDLVDLLASLRVTLTVAPRLPAEAQANALGNAQALLDDVLHQVNELAQDLWPSALNHLGLLSALIWYFERYTGNSQVQVDFRHHGLNVSLDSQLKIMVYRIIQEALANVAHHAGVDNVHVRLWVEDEMLSLHINDVGRGFDLDQVMRQEESAGLLGMQERAHLLGGSLMITTAEDTGTQLVGRFPLKPAEREIKTQPASDFQANTDLYADQFPTEPPVPDHTRLTVAIVEDNEILRWGIQELLRSDLRFQVVGEAATGHQAMQLVHNLQPDILILGFPLSDESSLEMISQLCEQTRILVIANYAEPAYAAEAQRLGVYGYIQATANLEEYQRALESIAASKPYFSPPVPPTELSDSPLDSFATLTKREREVFYLVLDDMTNKEIAQQLVVSPRTVETHRLNMMRKLGVKGQGALMRYALDRGLWSPDRDR